MSAESIQWLNTYTLQSRAVWHTSAKIQQMLGKPTVYDGPIPAEDVLARLFNWEPLEAEVSARATILSPDGVEQVELGANGHKAICRPPRALSPEDPGAILCVPKESYRPHSYGKWLVENVANLLDGDLAIYSAGLLRGGALAWVQITVPDTITTPVGFPFRPFLLAATSLDKSLATTYKRGFKAAVCDNTLSAAIAELAPTYRVKHSSGSEVKLAEARADLQIQFEESVDAFSAELASLNATTVTDAEFDRFLESIAPTTDKDGLKTGRAATIAKNKQDELRQLWRTDPRVSPWKNTALGVVQAVNTHSQHVASVRGDRDETNMRKSIYGDVDRLDVDTLTALTAVLA